MKKRFLKLAFLLKQSLTLKRHNIKALSEMQHPKLKKRQ